jgi:ferritin-like protein
MPASENLHEPADKLSPETIEFHRAVVSLMEELDAIDWYNQRAEACGDSELRKILQHNRDEEIEHAVMALEWIRRNSSKFDEALRTYLFTTGDITAIEEKETQGDRAEAKRGGAPEKQLTIGEMKGSGS